MAYFRVQPPKESQGVTPWDSGYARCIPKASSARALTVEALSRAIPQETIRAGSTADREQARARERKLSLPVVVWLVIGLHVYTTLSISAVLAKLARGLRLLWSDPLIALPTDSALTYRRYQVGARPLALLFHQVCQPIATQADPRSVSLRLAADGAGWHGGRRAGYPSQCGRVWSAYR